MSHTHIQPSTFFKYVAPPTALAVLKSRTFRYSSPLKFNDPFDVQSGLHIDFDLHALPETILDRLQGIAKADHEPIIEVQDEWGELVLLIRKLYRVNELPRERWKNAFVRPLVVSCGTQHSK